MIVVYEMVAITCSDCVVGTLFTLLYGLIQYTEACLFDIKSLFAQMDRPLKEEMSKSLRRKELRMLERCKEAVDLHGRLNG